MSEFTPPVHAHVVNVSRRYENSASGALLAGWAALSIAMHIGVFVGVPSGSGGSARGDAVGIQALRAAIVPSGTAIDSNVSSDLPDRLVPLPPQAVRPLPRLIPMATAESIRPAFDEAAYYRASQLTERALAAEYIVVPYPKEVAQPSAWRTLLAVYIDEDGTVAHVSIAGTRIPVPFESAAIAAFSRARYHPGRIGDRPVKSRMLVEVEFDNSDAELPTSPVLAISPNKR